MILHIPHSSTDTLGKEFFCDLKVELDRMTDIDTDKLYDYSHATKVIFSLSRLICDVERFEDDNLEEMAQMGMGVCYTKTAHGETLRIFEEGEREEIIEQYYRPHHQALTDAVAKELEEHGRSLVVDCHSFPNEPLQCNLSQKIPRPDICIGTDLYHTPEALIGFTKEHFISCGYTVNIDDPFAGTLIPMEYYQTDKRVKGIMIEVNRNLYQDNFERVKQNIQDWLREIDNILE